MCFWSDWSTNSRGRDVELEELTINIYLFATTSCNLIKSTHISTVLSCIPLLIIVAGLVAKERSQ